jgi:hypothetical protein
MSKIPVLHVKALKILREERELLVEDLKDLKKKIPHLQHLQVKEWDDYEYFKWEAIYGGNVSKLMKLRSQCRKDLNGIEESIKVLKEHAKDDYQARLEDLEYIEAAASGSYNCLGGC